MDDNEGTIRADQAYGKSSLGDVSQESRGMDSVSGAQVLSTCQVLRRGCDAHEGPLLLP